MIDFHEITKAFQGKSVALVGPANNLVGQKKGQLIDSHEIVARLNDSYIIEQSQYEDYGSRCDVLFNTCNCELLCIIKRFSQYLNNCKVIINPTSKVHGSDYKNTGNSVYQNYLTLGLDIPFYQVEEPFESLMVKQGLNTGMCALTFLKSLNIKLSVFGFSFHGVNDSKYEIDSQKVDSYNTYLFDYKKVYTCKTDCPPEAPCRARSDPRYALKSSEASQINYFNDNFLNAQNISIDQTITKSL
jgi:hypothetical protein|tara:strand:- start:370 stop:1101 length:732 start_codon:yes stop_codon:yes gene_type:complete